MAFFFISYCDDEAVFLVQAKDAQEAKGIWLINREEAGCEDLHDDGIIVDGPVQFDGGVADVTKLIF